MKLLNRLAKPFYSVAFAISAFMSLVSVAPAVFAADKPDVEFSQAELDQMLAPIALYPDALLSQVLIASTYPLEIVQADRWVRSNKDLKTEDALKFAENKDWDPSVKALVAFPDILHRLSDDVDWTQRLGDAFLSDEDDVMDAVQRLRKRAYASGNLDKAQHITVERDNDDILIEPAEERIVYVPVYDTRVVYGNWWWPDYPPVYWNYPNYAYTSGFYWGPSIFLGSTYFYSSVHWRDRRVVVIDRNYHDRPRFYTGRSIAHFEGSRDWHHDPVHRHGVAYYNNNLRQTYGSNRQSYQNDRTYREQHRDASRRDQGPGPVRSFGTGLNSGSNDNQRKTGVVNNNVNERHFDRADQVRDRLNRTNGENITTSGMRTPSQALEARNGFNDRNRTSTQNRQIQTNSNNTNTNDGWTNDGSRAQGRRIVTDGGDRRPNISSPAQQRAPEQQTVNPQPRIERQSESPRQTESINQARAEQRTERMGRSFSRDRSDNNDKK